MPTVRISGTPHTIQKKEWIGVAKLDDEGKIERSLAVPEAVLAEMESQIRQGATEGAIRLPDGKHFDFFVDR